MIRPRFLPAAEAEFLKEVAYYSVARDGLGIRFLAAVAEAIARAAANPSAGAPFASGTRSVRVKAFPFNVVYRADDRELLIVAVRHHGRQPTYWVSRVK